MGRPSKTKDIDRGMVERMLERFNPLDAVCYYLGISRTTLRGWVRCEYDGMAFEDLERRCQAKGRATLMEYAFNMAKTNPAVLIFMLKNFCGMSDDPRPVDTGEERREFLSAMKSATKALSGSDLSRIADIPAFEEAEGGADDEILKA